MWLSFWLELLDTTPEQPLGLTGFHHNRCSFLTPLPVAAWFVALSIPHSLTRSPPFPHHITTMSGISEQAPSGTGEQNRSVFTCRGCS